MAAYDYASATGYARGRANWLDWPNMSTPVQSAHYNRWDQAIADLKGLTYNVKDYGAVGDNTTDDTTAIQAALDAVAAGGGIVYFPPGLYLISASLTVKARTRLVGANRYKQFVGGNDHPASMLLGTALNAPIIDSAGVQPVEVTRLGFRGSGASGSIGIKATLATNWQISECLFDNFGDQAILLTSGSVPMIDNCFVQNTLLVRTGRTGYVGAVEVSATDAVISRCEVTTSSSADDTGNGYICAFLLDGDNGFIYDCIGEISETGFVVSSNVSVAGWRMMSCRADQNQRDGFIINGSLCQITNCFAYRNSRKTNNTYDGFVVAGGFNTLVNCMALDVFGDGLMQRYGFRDALASANVNVYMGCTTPIIGTGTFATGTTRGLGPPSHLHGAGSPEGVLAAAIGTLYSRTDGGAATSLYVKESGTGNTGWIAK